MKHCLLCAEEIQDQAVVCRFCGASLTGPSPTVAVRNAPRTTETGGLAVASMVLGIVWLYWVGSILALVLGYLARREMDREPGRFEGRGIATAGIVLGWIGMATLAATVIWLVVAGVGGNL